MANNALNSTRQNTLEKVVHGDRTLTGIKFISGDNIILEFKHSVCLHYENSAFVQGTNALKKRYPFSNLNVKTANVCAVTVTNRRSPELRF